jgi:membrane-associated phospholipid phosphatase
MIDAWVSSFVRRHWGSRIDAVAIAVSHAGRGGLLWLVADAALQAHDSHLLLPSRRVVRAVALSYGCSLVLARMVGRKRPCHSERSALIECPEGPSFPSDQTAAAFAGAEAIRRQHPRAAGALYAAAAAIAVARVYCGVHHVTDTLAGAAFGIATGAVTAARVKTSDT